MTMMTALPPVSLHIGEGAGAQGLQAVVEATEDMLLCGVLFTEKGVCFLC